MNAYEAHAAELVRVDEVAELVERLADPCITLALTAALMGRPLDYTDRKALTELRTLCQQTQASVDSYVAAARRDAA